MTRSDLNARADAFTAADLRELAEWRDGPCVSILLPTHRAGSETQQDPIRARNLLESARRSLDELDEGSRRAAELLGPLRALFEDGDFWRHQGNALAVYAAPGFTRRFRLDRTLPELVSVGERFRVRPILGELDSGGHFWVLALAQNQVRLHRATRFAIDESVTGPIPSSMAEALAHEDPQQQLQYRSGGGQGAQFHGHGAGDEVDKQALERFLRAVDRGVLDAVGDDSSPLVLATVGYYAPIYRSVTRHPRVVERIVEGSPERRSAAELHAAAWTIIEPIVAQQRETALAAVREAPTGRVASDVSGIVGAARVGAVSALMVTPDASAWGTFDEAMGQVTLLDEDTPGAEDLLDIAVAETVRTGGRAYVVEPSELAGQAHVALLRY